MRIWRLLNPVALVAAAVVAFFPPTMSGATFTSNSANAVSTVTAAPDWTPPTVTMTSPSTAVSGTVTVNATASDAQSGVASVALQALAPGGSWATICTDSVTPYSCSWNTTLGADGLYSLRAIATDNAGYSTTSEAVTTTVANNLLVTLSNPGDFVAGSVGLTATLYNTGGLPYAVTIQYAVSGTTTWSTLCVLATAPYTCTWNTTAHAYTQGQSYDLRAVATSGLSTAVSAVVVGAQVDNVAPTVTMTDPGTPLSGTVTFAATATDADSGVASVQLQYQFGGVWTTFCTAPLAPYSCTFNTTTIASGTYAFRAIAVDSAGNSTTSSSVTNRVIDNTVDSVTMTDPGSYLNGSITLKATANSNISIAGVRIDRAPSGTGTWTTVCTATASPYTCPFDTKTVVDGFYDFRAVLTDGIGKVTTSATVTSRRIDNSPLRGYNVQALSGGATAGLLDSGDVLKLTYSAPVNFATITPGWAGAATPVSLRLRDGSVLGLTGSDDTLDVLVGGNPINLGSVNLRGNYIKNKTAIFNASMAASTAVVNGVSATVITVTVGSLASGSGLRVGAATSPIWTPSTLATDLYAHGCSAAPVTQLGSPMKAF